MQRRSFLTLFGGTAAALPLAASAQQPVRMRRIGVLMNRDVDDPEAKVRLGAFLQGLAQLGWTDGRNVRIDTRWTRGNADDTRKYAAELVALAPDVIHASGASTVGPLLQAYWLYTPAEKNWATHDVVVIRLAVAERRPA